MLIVGLMTGCGQERVTDPPRTATEQFLISAAARRAVAQLSTDAMRDRLVFMDTRFFETVDHPYVLGELRAHLLLNGVRLVEERDGAQIVMEVRSGGIGVDRHGGLIGIPETLLTPDISIVKDVQQMGYASIAYIAYWRESGEVVTSSGPHVGRSYRDDWWLFGSGPRSAGDIATINLEE